MLCKKPKYRPYWAKGWHLFLKLSNCIFSAGALAEIPTETEGLQTEKLEAPEKSLPTEGVQLLSRYCLHDDWNCKEKNFQLSKGDIVEVLDMEKKAEWLVRLEKDREKVIFKQNSKLHNSYTLLIL